jgi:hypothetical protein
MPRQLPVLPNTPARRVNEQIEPYISPADVPTLPEDRITRANQISVDIENDITPISFGLQDIDEAVFFYFNNVIKPTIVQNGNQLEVPVSYASAERWVSVQRDGYFRDKNGKAMHPYIIVRRTGFEKNRTLANKLDGNGVNNFAVAQGRYNSKNQYTNFDILNNYLPSEKFYLTPVPDYINVTYECAIITNFIQENNKIVEAIEFASDSYWGNKNRYQFRTYIDRFDSTNEYGISDQRIAKTNLSITLYGYIIPETINRDLATNGQRQFFSKSVVSITAETVVNANGPAGAPTNSGDTRRPANPTPTPSITPSISVTPGLTPSISVTPSITPSISVLPSVTPSITPSLTPSITPSLTPSITPSPPTVYGGSIDFGNEYGRYAATNVASTDYTLGYNDFTIEWFQKLSVVGSDNETKAPFSIFNSETEYLQFAIDTQPPGLTFNLLLNSYSSPGGFSYSFVTSVPPATLLDWTHIAISRVGTAFNIYVNGALSNPGNSIGTLYLTPLLSKLYIGNLGNYFPTIYRFPGKITNFNFVNGTALYTADFTPPTSPIIPSTNTKLLLLATNNAGLMTDSSGLNVTVDNINGLTWSSDNPF